MAIKRKQEQTAIIAKIKNKTEPKEVSKVIS